MMNRERMGIGALWFGLVAVAAALFVSSEVHAQGGPPAALVRLEPIKTMEVERRRSVTGDLRASARSRVASQVEGRVIEMLVDIGDEVERGAVIARLDKELLEIDLTRVQAQIRAGEAVLKEREASIRLAQFDVESLETLSRSQGATVRELEDAKATLDEANARLAVAQAEIAAIEADAARIRKRIADTEVRAPFSGQVIAKSTEVGEWLAEGGEVVELVSIETIDAYVDVPQQFIAALQHMGRSIEAGGDRPTVSIKIDALGTVVESSDIVVIGDGDRLARSFPVRVRIVNPDRDLKPGMSVTGSVPTGERMTALTISKDAVLRDAAGTIAFFDGGGMAAVQAVDLLFAVGDRFVIRDKGWAEGMRVVIEGNERLRPGTPLQELGAPPPGAGGGGEVAGNGGGSQEGPAGDGEGE